MFDGLNPIFQSWGFLWPHRLRRHQGSWDASEGAPLSEDAPPPLRPAAVITRLRCVYILFDHIWSECDWHSFLFDFLKSMCACMRLYITIYYMHIHLHLYMIKYILYVYTTCSYIHTYIYLCIIMYVGRWVTNMHRIYECSVCMNIFAIMYQKIQHPTRQYIHTLSSL